MYLWAAVIFAAVCFLYVRRFADFECETHFAKSNF